MRLFAFALAGVVCGVSASPTKLSSREVHPCAEVSASASVVLAASPDATPIVGAQLAYDCLNSVPLEKDRALELVNALFPYIEWQSDIAYLKNPPDDYKQPGVDIHGELETIIQNLDADKYKNEYTFQTDLFDAFSKAHDSHFHFYPDIMMGALSFERNVALVSVSMDGTELPKIYTHSDIDAYVAGGSEPSSVVTINGQDAETFLMAMSQQSGLNDDDAQYNSMFFGKAFAAENEGWKGFFEGHGVYTFIYPGTTTILGFQNGTSNTYDTTSSVMGDFTGVTDGHSAYEKFCNGDAGAKAAIAKFDASGSPSSDPAVPGDYAATGFPEPELISQDKVVSGYFLDSTANSDVAVLSLLNFTPEIPREYQAVVEQFLASAKAAGKKKLVIDLSGNGGGYLLQSYDTFRQLFPQTVQNGYSRFRNHKMLAVMAEQYAIALKDYHVDTASEEEIDAYKSVANYRDDLDINLNPFTSVEGKFGPHEFHDDKFTSLLQWDLNDPLTTTNESFGYGMEITGYGDRTGFTQPFASEDIILLYDGFCASSCAIFAELMRTQTNVKSIVIGGRPTRDAMQTIGGTKGVNSYGFDYIYHMAQFAYKSTSWLQKLEDKWDEISEMSSVAFTRAVGSRVNARDNMLPKHFEDGMPAQFVYENADCRLFYEPSMLVHVQDTWEAAANAAWGGKACIQGSLGGLKKRTIEKREKELTPRAEGSRLPTGTFTKAKTDKWWQTRQGSKVFV